MLGLEATDVRFGTYALGVYAAVTAHMAVSRMRCHT